MIDRCPACDYSLEGLPEEHTCPECGFAYEKDATVYWQRRGDKWYNVLGLEGVLFVPVLLLAAYYGVVWAGLVLLAFGLIVYWAWPRRPTRFVSVSPRCVRMIDRGTCVNEAVAAGIRGASWSGISGAVSVIGDREQELFRIPSHFLGSHENARRLVEHLRMLDDSTAAQARVWGKFFDQERSDT